MSGKCLRIKRTYSTSRPGLILTLIRLYPSFTFSSIFGIIASSVSSKPREIPTSTSAFLPPSTLYNGSPICFAYKSHTAVSIPDLAILLRLNGLKISVTSFGWLISLLINNGAKYFFVAMTALSINSSEYNGSSPATVSPNPLRPFSSITSTIVM